MYVVSIYSTQAGVPGVPGHRRTSFLFVPQYTHLRCVCWGMREYGPGRRNQQPEASINAESLLYEGYSRKCTQDEITSSKNWFFHISWWIPGRQIRKKQRPEASRMTAAASPEQLTNTIFVFYCKLRNFCSCICIRSPSANEQTIQQMTIDNAIAAGWGDCTVSSIWLRIASANCRNWQNLCWSFRFRCNAEVPGKVSRSERKVLPLQ